VVKKIEKGTAGRKKGDAADVTLKKIVGDYSTVVLNQPSPRVRCRN
jgi:hypothetical protein